MSNPQGKAPGRRNSGLSSIINVGLGAAWGVLGISVFTQHDTPPPAKSLYYKLQMAGNSGRLCRLHEADCYTKQNEREAGTFRPPDG